MAVVELAKKPDESELAYIQRLGMAKYEGLLDMTWQELADVFNRNLREPGCEYTESAYRKKFASIRQVEDEFGSGKTELDEIEELKTLKKELEKERVKLRDERTEYRRLIREEARKESYQEQFVRSIEEASGANSLDYHYMAPNIFSNSDLLIALSDIHAGIEIHNFWNDYDSEILRIRMDKYLDRVLEIKKRHSAQNAYVVCSEILSGIIHPTLRIQNNQDLIDQFLTVSDYIADFLNVLSREFNIVNVYVAPGNHSRINPKKEQDLAHENMDNLLLPYLRAKLQNFENVKFWSNDIEQSMAVFSIRNINVVAVHGDRDSFDTVADRINKFLRLRVDLIVTGHKHTNALKTDGDVKVVQCGCLSGSDEFATNSRLRNKPEQVVCVINEENGLDCLYDIKL